MCYQTYFSLRCLPLHLVIFRLSVHVIALKSKSFLSFLFTSMLTLNLTNLSSSFYIFRFYIIYTCTSKELVIHDLSGEITWQQTAGCRVQHQFTFNKARVPWLCVQYEEPTFNLTRQSHRTCSTRLQLQL